MKGLLGFYRVVAAPAVQVLDDSGKVLHALHQVLEVAAGHGMQLATGHLSRREIFSVVDVPGGGREQVWSSLDAGSQSVWPTVTGANFESGFSDAILQMLAVFLAEREGALGDRFGCATPDEATLTHAIYNAAVQSHETGEVVRVGG